MLVRLLRQYLRPYRRQIAILVVLLVAQTVGNLYLPNLNADIINNGVVAGNLHYILSTGVVMLAFTLVVGVCAVVAVYWASRVAMGVGADIREALALCAGAAAVKLRIKQAVLVALLLIGAVTPFQEFARAAPRCVARESQRHVDRCRVRDFPGSLRRAAAG